MGNIIYSTSDLVSNLGDLVGRKRKRCESDEDTINKIVDSALHTPKRKKLINPAQYIYHTLFEEGKNSDITVCALDEEFRLHKIYLCQSPYFASMFGGSWIESTKTYISIDVVDPQITQNALKIVFGSLYNYEIILNPLEIVSVLATATMFQLENLIEKCSEVMLETINPKTSLDYYNAFCCYGDRKLQDVCFKWFLNNLLTFYFNNTLSNLKNIPIDLMTKLVADPDLVVIQTEYSVYVMLKYWMYIIVHCVEGEPSVKDINNFYCSRKGDQSYLFTDEGRQFTSTFKSLRLHSLISHLTDVDSIIKDNIIPKEWLNVTIVDEWKKVLRVNQNADKGPVNISDEIFLSTCLRCGRTITQNEKHIWRWTGFHFGFDLLMIVDDKSLSVRRNHRSESEQLLSWQNIRHIAIRVTVIKLNEQRQIIYSKNSGIHKLSLTKGEEVHLMTLDKDLTFPIIISANILYTSPINQQIIQEEPIQSIT